LNFKVKFIFLASPLDPPSFATVYNVAFQPKVTRIYNNAEVYRLRVFCGASLFIHSLIHSVLPSFSATVFHLLNRLTFDRPGVAMADQK